MARLIPWRQRSKDSAAPGEAASTGDLQAPDLMAAAPLSGVAAIESVSGLWARSVASARLHAPPWVIGLLGPDKLAVIGRELIECGNSVWMLTVSPMGEPDLLHCDGWSIEGGAARDTWRYLVTVGGPTTSRTMWVDGAAIVHARMNAAPNAYWCGRPVWNLCRVTAAAAGIGEKRLAAELASPVGSLVLFDQAVAKDQADTLTDKTLNRLRGAVRAVIGRQGLGSMTGGEHYRQPGVTRIGAAPPDSIIKVRQQSLEHLANAAGVPTALLTANSAGIGVREAFRQFVAGSVSPICGVIAAELARVCECPVTLSTAAMLAGDVAGRARAFKILAENFRPETAAMLTGFDPAGLRPEGEQNGNDSVPGADD